MVEKKEVYESFQDIPPREYMYFPKGVLKQSKPGDFSGTEVFHLLVSIVVVVFSFSFALTGHNLLSFMGLGLLPTSVSVPNLEVFTGGLLFSSFGVLTAFFSHELAHKFMAQRYGLWSEYRMYPLGLLLALLLGLSFGLVFAAPGAVMFRGNSRDFENGMIAVSGVSMNILISAVMLPLYFFVFYETFFESVIGFVCVINAFLAAFNLLPIYPLDGAKIVRWNFNVWFFLFVFAAGLAFYGLREIPLSFSI